MKQYPRIPPDAERCSKPNVADDTGWHFNRCKRRGVVEEDGKLWCKQHSPSAKRTRLEAATARYNAQNEARNAPYRKIERLEDINRDLLAALKELAEHPDDSTSRARARAFIAKAELPA